MNIQSPSGTPLGERPNNGGAPLTPPASDGSVTPPPLSSPPLASSAMSEMFPQSPKGTPRAATPKEEPSPNKRSPRHSRRRRSTSRAGSRTRNEILESMPPNSSAAVYRNLLALEQSIRTQYLEMVQKRRKNLTFFVILCMAMAYFSYAVFVEPSIYGLFSFLQRVGFISTLITVGLFLLTGLYNQTFVEYPRFLGSANKGLRSFNVKVVRVKSTWKEALIRAIWAPGYTSRPGRLVKIVLSTRAFSSETIEGWEIYRQEYWEREHDRMIRRHRTPAKDQHSQQAPTHGHRRRPTHLRNETEKPLTAAS
uniref:ARAD1C05764p n=1 Tax=Blastobotrys adeninivorans TaxID=409370 RepID=A0A060T5I6_BLAAD